VTVVRSISSLFAGTSRRDGPVAVVGGKSISFAEFERDVAALSAALGAKPGQRWMLLSADAYAVAVGLLAAFHAERTIILPANFQAGHLGELSRGIDGVLVHDQTAPPVAHQLAVFGHDAPAAGGALDGFNTEDVEVILHTSGTTGKPEPIAKSIRCLDAEVEAIAATFPRDSAATIHATVPAHHLYGLLFRLLVPLSVGEPFFGETLRYPEELQRLCETEARILLISSPAFLQRALQVLDMDVLKDRITGLFSSGGPLPPETAAAFHSGLAKPIVEIYGSTETGAIAHRIWQGAAQPEPLTPLAGVTLSVDPDNSILTVKSPFLHAMPSYRTGDRVNLLPDGRFELLGRADRIVKIEERRVSLYEVEKLLSAQADISAVQVELLEGRGGRKFLGAAIVPTAEGWSALKENGKRALAKQMRAALMPYLDLAALPRKWRFVKRLPETVKGTPSVTQFRALFGDSEHIVAEPLILDRSAEPSALRIKLKLPTELKYFDGHFEGFPILAGVVQLAWAGQFARSEFSLDGVFQRIEALKFFRVLTAEDEVTLALSYDRDKGLVHFRYENGEFAHAAGRIRFGASA